MELSPSANRALSSGGAISPRLALSMAVVFSLLAIVPLRATQPTWWTGLGAVNPSATPNDWAMVTEGQLKQFTLEGVTEMNTYLLPIGAGNNLNMLVDGWIADYATNGYSGSNPKPSDFQAMSAGQLKYIGGMVWTQLVAGGYTSSLPSWLVVTSTDAQAANLGQLKTVFNFDLTYSSDGSSLPDWWLIHYFGGLTLDGTAVDPNAFVPWSGGNLTYLQAFQLGLNPIDFYNGQTPVLTKVSGDAQTGGTGGFLSAPLVVSVTAANGNPLYDAPVTFTVTSGGGQVQKSSIGSLAGAITVLAASSGQAQAFFQLPATVSSSSQITVTTGTGSAAAPPVTFTEYSDNGAGGPYRSPFSPSNVVGVINADGSEDMTWQNNTDPSDQTPIPIWHWDAGTQSWRQIDSVPAGTTSYHVPPNP
jgi:hypothetical protein